MFCDLTGVLSNGFKGKATWFSDYAEVGSPVKLSIVRLFFDESLIKEFLIYWLVCESLAFLDDEGTLLNEFSRYFYFLDYCLLKMGFYLK